MDYSDLNSVSKKFYFNHDNFVENHVGEIDDLVHDATLYTDYTPEAFTKEFPDLVYNAILIIVRERIDVINATYYDMVALYRREANRRFSRSVTVDIDTLTDIIVVPTNEIEVVKLATIYSEQYAQLLAKGTIKSVVFEQNAA